MSNCRKVLNILKTLSRISKSFQYTENFIEPHDRVMNLSKQSAECHKPLIFHAEHLINILK